MGNRNRFPIFRGKNTWRNIYLYIERERERERIVYREGCLGGFEKVNLRMFLFFGYGNEGNGVF